MTSGLVFLNYLMVCKK